MPYFINPGCYGDDVARWLILQLEGMTVDRDLEPEQEDFGWFFEYRLAGRSYCFVVTYRPDSAESGTWIGGVEAGGGIWCRIRDRNRIDLSASRVIHEALSASTDITSVRWHLKREFDRGSEAGHSLPEEVFASQTR